MDKFFKAVKQDGAFFVVLGVLNLPIFLQAFVGNKELLPSLDKIFLYAKYFWLSASLMFVLMLTLNFTLTKKKKLLKLLLQKIFMAIFATLFASESFFLYKFRRAFDFDVTEIFLENLFLPEVLISCAVFVTLLIIGIDDLRKIFKSMSAKKIKRLTYALIIFSLIGIIFICEIVVIRTFY